MVQFEIVSTHQVETTKNSVTKVVRVMKEFTVPVPAYCGDLFLSRGEPNIRLRTQGSTLPSNKANVLLATMTPSFGSLAFCLF